MTYNQLIKPKIMKEGDSFIMKNAEVMGGVPAKMEDIRKFDSPNWDIPKGFIILDFEITNKEKRDN